MSARIADIEVLRAIAVAVVVFQHLDNLFPWPVPILELLYTYGGGTFGVDLFFAVSGFVIARDLVPRLREASNGGSPGRVMIAFWARRVWRLWPSAFLWLGLILLAVLFFNSSGVFGSLKANLEATLAGVFHFANIRAATHFMVSEVGTSFVYWSLSLEEQFYLVFPVLIILFRRNLGWLMLAIALVQIVLPRQTPYLMVFRTDALALGVLIALWSHHQSWQLGRDVVMRLGRMGCLALALCAIVAMALLSGRIEVTPYKMGLIAVSSALLVLLASYDEDLLSPRGYLRRLLMWVGGRSYAIYLIHVPAFFAVREGFYRWGPANTAPDMTNVAFYMVCMLFLLLLLAEMNFRYVEMPLRKRGVTVSKQLLDPRAEVVSELSSTAISSVKPIAKV